MGICLPVNTCSRSEEHTSELQSRGHLVCRLLLDKKKIQIVFRHTVWPYLVCLAQARWPPLRNLSYNAPATPQISPLSLHDALPISLRTHRSRLGPRAGSGGAQDPGTR